MTMQSRFRSLRLFAVVTLLGLVSVACGTELDGDGDIQDDVAQPDDPGGPDDDAPDKETVRISFLGPMSGGNARIGIAGRNAAELAVRQANERSDLQYHYELVSGDTECLPQAGTQAALRAASDPLVAITVANYCSTVALAAAEIYHEEGLPAIVWGAIHPGITFGNDYPEVTRINGTQIEESRDNYEFAREVCGAETFTVLHDTTDYGRGFFELFEEDIAEGGGEIVDIFAVDPEQQDFNTEATRIRSVDPDVVWFAGLTPVGVRVKRQLDDLGVDAQFIGVSGIFNQDFNDTLGDSAEGVVSFIDGLPPEMMPGGPDFLAAYDEAGFEEPVDAKGPFAYAGTQLAIEAIEAVGPDREAIVEWLNSEVNDVDSIVGPVTFDEYGQNEVAFFTPMVSVDGEWVPFEGSPYETGERALPCQQP